MDILKIIANKGFRHAVAQSVIACLVLTSLTVVCYRLYLNIATACLLYIIVVVFLARAGNFASSIVASIIAALCLAHLAPPAYSFRVDDPLDDVAIAAFLITSSVIARLVSKLHEMRDEAASSVNRKLRSEEHTSELQSRLHLVCRLLLEKQNEPKREEGKGKEGKEKDKERPPGQ